MVKSGVKSNVISPSDLRKLFLQAAQPQVKIIFFLDHEMEITSHHTFNFNIFSVSFIFLSIQVSDVISHKRCPYISIILQLKSKYFVLESIKECYFIYLGLQLWHLESLLISFLCMCWIFHDIHICVFLFQCREIGSESHEDMLKILYELQKVSHKHWSHFTWVYRLDLRMYRQL